VLALARAARYGQWLQRPEGTVPELADISPDRARAVLQRAGSGWLSPGDVRAILTAYAIRVPQTRVVGSAPDAVEAARAIGYPVALKLLSRQVLHETEVGGVRLGLSSDDDVRDAFAAVRHGLAARGAGAAFEGAVIQQMRSTRSPTSMPATCSARSAAGPCSTASAARRRPTRRLWSTRSCASIAWSASIPRSRNSTSTRWRHSRRAKGRSPSTRAFASRP
jgi:hypothetical protein